ncbi:MAG TPA: ISKra4 family transposase [Streptosporangiaceae bacterium]|nr:ISKra4 family transposase [Streptosporangiaceae bacterium]
MSGYVPDAAFARSREAFAQAEEWLAGLEAAGLGHAAVEEELAARGREIQRRLLQDHLDLRAAREQRRERVTGPDGIARTRAERGHGRLLSSVFGPVMVSRIAYRAPGAPNAYPADAALRLPPGRHSHGVCKKVAAAAARGSFAQACADVTGATGSRLGKRQCQELARQAAADFESFYASRQPPPAGPGTVLALSCDGKGIVVLPGQMRPDTARRARRRPGPKQDGRLSRGEVRNRRRIAETGAVFDITPVPRTAQDILGPGPRPPGPAAAGKWVTASVAADAAAVVAAVFAEASRRDPDHQRTWIALADGNVHQIRRIQAEAAARDITITIICDFIHVLEHLWDAAWSFFDEASPDAGPWVRARAAAILDGYAADVAATLRAAARSLGKTRRKAAEKTAGYLDAKSRYLDYPTALANGWPISSGVIEGTCRHLVKDRMDITGARWGIATAEAVLQLRALHANGDFDAYWTYHLNREHERNHPARYALAA